MTTADSHSYQRLSCHIGDITVLTTTTINAAQIAKAALTELGAFLFAVKEVFGTDKVQKAADLWIRRLETTDWMGSNNAKAFRRITIRTLAQLADDLTLQAFSPAWQPSGAWSKQVRNRQTSGQALPGDYLGEQAELGDQGSTFKEHAQDGHVEAAGLRGVADSFGGTACALCAGAN